ncbi:MAG: ZIP family metal transporter [Candidatus Bathyarchaeia archaeon]|jgi:ZIP family zinc transporter
MDVFWFGLLVCVLVGLSTGLGALPILFTKKISDKTLDVLLGFSAGVMLAATCFSLLVPAVDLGGPLIAVAGIALGALTLHLIDRFVPHFHPISGPEGPKSKMPKVWLFVIAITIHNFPEGLAVGLGFGSGDVSAGLIIAVAIALQNMPEGLAVALPLVREGYSRRKSLAYATLTGLVEPLGGLLGLVLVSVFLPFQPFGLAFAGGAMLFVVSDEMIPESHRKGFERQATFGLLVGFMLMMFLDCLLV